MELLGLRIHLVISAPQVSQQRYYNLCVHVSVCIDEPSLEGVNFYVHVQYDVLLT